MGIAKVFQGMIVHQGALFLVVLHKRPHLQAEAIDVFVGRQRNVYHAPACIHLDVYAFFGEGIIRCGHVFQLFRHWFFITQGRVGVFLPSSKQVYARLYLPKCLCLSGNCNT